MTRAAFVAPVLLFCACTQRPAALPTSSGQPAYALHYASELSLVQKTIDDGQLRSKSLTTGLDSRIDELKKPRWDFVRAIVDDSDAVGRSADFAESHDGVTDVRSFWSDEKEPVTSRVAGSTQGVVQKAHCSGTPSAHGTDAPLDVRGTIAYSLNESIDKQLAKRLRSRNDAFLLIERYKNELGPQNVAILEKLADDIAEASYTVHVEMPAERERLTRLLADKQAVSDTLVRYAQDEKAYERTAGRTDAEVKAGDERIAAANRSQADVAAAASQAESVDKALDDRLSRAVKDYDDALSALRAKIDEKKKAASQ